jgi:hypothetical protein
MCAIKQRTKGQGRLRPVLAGYYLFLITGQVGYQKEFEKLNPPVISFTI